MVDLGIVYVQVKSAEGSYVFRMEPDIDALMQFNGFTGVTLPYFGRQLVSKQIEIERIYRATPKTSKEDTASETTTKKGKSPKAAARLPNHLQRLLPKRLDSAAASKATTKEVVSLNIYFKILFIST